MIEKFKSYILESLRSARKTGDLPGVVALSTYADDPTLARFRPDEQWPGGAAEHERAMLEIAAEIGREFPSVRVELVPIEESEYETWLARKNFEDSPGRRAQFISESPRG